MISLASVRPITGDSGDMCDVIDYHGQSIWLIDMRKKMGFKTAEVKVKEFIDLMNVREEDHKKWLSTLEMCIQDGKEFTLALDPMKCQFGRWYYDFLPKVKDNNLLFYLEKFDEPHKKIHAIAEKSFAFVHSGAKDMAVKLIEETRGKELSEMIKLFSTVKRIYKSNQREIVIVIDPQLIEKPLGLVVDEIIMVENLPKNNWKQINNCSDSEHEKLITGFGEFKEIESLVMTLDISCLA